MLSFRIIAVTATVIMGVVLAGCGQQAGSPPPGSTQRAATSGSTEQTLASGTVQEEECPPNALCAPPNEHPVPDVVGMKVPQASRTLSRSGYGCAIWAERKGEHAAGPRRVVAQKERPGSKGFEGNLIHLTVSKPYPEGYHYPRKGLLPPDCVDQRNYPR
jgi:hypothetical protein